MRSKDGLVFIEDLLGDNFVSVNIIRKGVEMKNFKTILFLFVFLMCVSVAAFAEENRDADHNKLRELKSKVTNAFNKRDAREIASCFTEKFSITTIDQTTLTSVPEIENYFYKFFVAKDAIVADLKVVPEASVPTEFVDSDNGYCYGKTIETYKMKDGRSVSMESKWTAALHRENGEWKIAAIHAGVDFLDNPVLDQSVAKIKTFATGGFAAGVVVTLLGGLVVGRLRRK